MLLALIVACEIGFWAFLLAGLAARYLLRWKTVSSILLICVPLVDVVLLAATIADLRGGAVADTSHSLAAAYIGFSVAFGHSLVRWADAVHGHGLLYPNVLFTVWAAAGIGTPVVLTEHVGLVSFGGLLFLLGFWWLLHGLLESEASRVREAKEHLSRILDLQTEYRAATARFDAQRDRLAESSSTPVSAFVEELATEHGLNSQLSAVRQQQSEEIGDVAQTRYTVELKKAMQEPLYRFLFALETSGYPARVEQATFKTTAVKGEKLMDLTLELVVLSVKEGT